MTSNSPMDKHPVYDIYATPDGVIWRRGKVMKPYPDRAGYDTITFWWEGKRVKKFIHTLVLECNGIMKPTPLHEVNHINHIRNDNNLSNLEWVTSSANSLHAHGHEDYLDPDAKVSDNTQKQRDIRARRRL